MKGRPTRWPDSLTLLGGGRHWSPGVPAWVSLTCVSREGCCVPRPVGEAVCSRVWLTEGAGTWPGVGLDGARWKRRRPPLTANAVCDGRAVPGLRAAVRERHREDQGLPSLASPRGLGPLAEEATGPGARDPQVGGSGTSGSDTHTLVQRNVPALGIHSEFSHKTRGGVPQRPRQRATLRWYKEAGTDSPLDTPSWGSGRGHPSIRLPRRPRLRVSPRAPPPAPSSVCRGRHSADLTGTASGTVCTPWDHQGPRVRGLLRAARRREGGRHAGEQPRSLSAVVEDDHVVPGGEDAGLETA